MEKTTKLMHDISTTETHTSQIEAEVESIDKDLTEIVKDLDYSRKVNDSLHSLDTALGTTSRLLTVVSIIPSIGSSASRLKKVIDDFHPPVKRAVKASDKVEGIVKPAREKIAKFEEKVEKVDNALLQLMNDENQTAAILGRAHLCIDSQSPSGVKSLLAAHMEKASATMDPPVLDFDAVQVKLLGEVKVVKEKADQLKSWIQGLVNLNAQIDSIMRTLRPLIDALNKVAAAFKQTVRVPYGGYPKICHEWWGAYPCGWHTVYYSFTIQGILDGAASVIKPVMDLLNKAMAKVLDPLLKGLNLDIALPEIKGLGILDELVADLDASFSKLISVFDQLLLSKSHFLDFLQELHNFRIDFINIDVTCPNAGVKQCGPTGCWIPVPAAG